jgi:hypothetical protein
MAPSKPTARVAAVRPPVTRAKPRFFAVLRPAGSPTFADVMQEALDIISGDGSDSKPAEQRLDVALDPPLVDCQCARLFWLFGSGEYAPGFGVGEIGIAEFGNSRRLAGRPLLGGRIGAIGDTPENA